MYTNFYKYTSPDNSKLPNLVKNSFDQIQDIEKIKNFLKRSAEEFETKQLLKKMKLVTSTDLSTVTYTTELTNDISYIEQVKNSSSNTNEVAKIIDKEIELINKKNTIESKICDPFVLSSNVNQQTSLQSPSSIDILRLAWSITGLSSYNNLESEGNTISSHLTNDVSSSDPTSEMNQEIPEPMKRSWKNLKYREMRAEAIKRSWEEEENKKKKQSELMKRTWEDPEYRKKISEAVKRIWEGPQNKKKKQSELMKRTWKDPEYRKIRTKIMKGTYENPEYRKKISEAMKRTCGEYKKKISEAMTQRWADPEYSKKMREAINRSWQNRKYKKKEVGNSYSGDIQKLKWGNLDLNQGPTGYESAITNHSESKRIH